MVQLYPPRKKFNVHLGGALFTMPQPFFRSINKALKRPHFKSISCFFLKFMVKPYCNFLQARISRKWLFELKEISGFMMTLTTRLKLACWIIYNHQKDRVSKILVPSTSFACKQSCKIFVVREWNC